MEDGTRAHQQAGTTIDDNKAAPDCIAENLSAAASSASVDVVRLKATAGRELVIGTISNPTWLKTA